MNRRCYGREPRGGESTGERVGRPSGGGAGGLLGLGAGGCGAQRLTGLGDAGPADLTGALIETEVGLRGVDDEGELVRTHESSIGRGYDKKRGTPKNFCEQLRADRDEHADNLLTTSRPHVPAAWTTPR
jgi:hypothetical protein